MQRVAALVGNGWHPLAPVEALDNHVAQGPKLASGARVVAQVQGPPGFTDGPGRKRATGLEPATFTLATGLPTTRNWCYLR